MKLFVEPFGTGRRAAWILGAFAIGLTAVMAFAARAQATETIYWNNFSADNVASANIDGSGGGLLSLGGQKIKSPEGMAYDPVTNRLFVASDEGGGQILAINADGSGATPFTAPGAPIEAPEGVAVDPATGTIYWANTKGSGSIAWAKLDGSAGGVLDTTGAEVKNPCCRIAIDPVGGRIYWVNFPSGTSNISFANLNDTGGGGVLSTSGSSVKPGGQGLAVDSAAGRLYFVGGNSEIGFANVNGSGGGDVSTGTAPVRQIWGIALDPSLGRLYWANEETGPSEASTAFGFVGTNGLGAGTIGITSSPVDNPQDPVIVKSPTGAGAPAVTQNVTALSCSQGSWSQDYPGSFVYGAPTSYTYQWLLNGAPIAGATSTTYTATASGGYSCAVTGKNPSGSASQTSSAVTVTPATLSLALTKKKPVKVKAGKTATVKIKIANSGQIGSVPVKVCAKLNNKAKKGLKAPKCASVAALGAGGSAVATLKVPTKKSAKGTYKFSAQVKGASVKSVTVKIQVTAAKKKH